MLKRLTDDKTRLYFAGGRTTGKQIDVKMFNKLHDLEDIEADLDIDLLTLYNAEEYGFYYIKDDKIAFCRWCIRIGRKLIETQPCYAVKRVTLESCYYGDVEEIEPVEDAHYFSWKSCVFVELSDYGKTWALTREELEKSFKGWCKS